MHKVFGKFAVICANPLRGRRANRSADLVRQLLAFSWQQTLQPRVLSMTDVLGDLSNLLRRLIGANIKLNMVHGRDLRQVRADQGQVEQVIINLAVNARDAMAEDGELTIETRNETLVSDHRRGVEPVPPGDYVIVKISDTGVGIPKENVEHIFEPFFSSDCAKLRCDSASCSNPLLFGMML